MKKASQNSVGIFKGMEEVKVKHDELNPILEDIHKKLYKINQFIDNLTK
jgi:hypothetical protein